MIEENCASQATKTNSVGVIKIETLTWLDKMHLYLTMKKIGNTMGKLCASKASKTQKQTYWNKQTGAGGPHLECYCTKTIITTLTDIELGLL